jgi:hypothetical protein
MKYAPTPLVRHSWSHPPRCLSGVKATPVTDAKEDHEAFSHFALSCRCGANVWRIVGFAPEPGLLLCPITLECSGCGADSEIFDVEKHGYDAELENGCCSRRAEGEAGKLSCRECRGHSFSATAIVSYQMDEDDIDADMEPRKQDLFDTFGLSVSCAGCGHTEFVCDYECA